ncbi:MAG: histidine kinase [Bacillus sp. (in: Bacteria)]|uniref:histidine kinase n=5 Tax=Bacillus TaxID=1386 RepID=D9YRL1_BACP9|nr:MULTISPECIES: ATP-binding protein [Bacillus]KJD53549.1 histidine kinase [Bacillus amyloliquefaciens]KUL09921.1 sensor histidine kinase [Bacillus licheniformis LMG 7559]ADK89165.1 ComP [Bacillus paralicheniformis ATCC 9945a]AGN37741.1 two-component sensor histidine kinase ComP [Bacillus paralicheniformis ATCC 9945a]KND07827.1 histidine kinase [Bacillus paralicheniformis]
MKSYYNKVSLVLILLSFIYVLYVCYLSFNNNLVGLKVKNLDEYSLEVVEVKKHTLAADYAELKEGDIIHRINGQQVPFKKDKEYTLSNVLTLTIERNGKVFENDSLIYLDLVSYDSFFIFIIPLIFYFLCLICVYFIFKVNKSKNLFSAFLLVLFLLITSIAYVSAGAVARGDTFSRFVNILTFLAVPTSYLHFIYRYFKEIGKTFFSNKVFLLYLIPFINLILEAGLYLFEFEGSILKSINLLSFFISTVIVFILITYALIKFKYSQQSYLLKILMLMNFIALVPFLFFYVLPMLVFGDYIFSAIVVSPFLLLIPLSLVYQFMSNKIYDIEFLIGRLKYYSFLAIIPTSLIITILAIVKHQEGEFFTVQVTIFTYLIMVGVFYLKEIIDFRFRLKRFSEKFNYQDSIFKFTQTIRTFTSLNQVLMELKQIVLDVLLVNNIYMLKVKNDGSVSMLENDAEEKPWIPYEQEVTKVITDIGKIVEVDRGFLIKIGERGGTSYVMLCLSVLNTPRLTRDEISWLETLAFYTSVSLENVLKIGELMEHLEHVKKEGPNPAWLNKLMFAIEEKQRSDLARDLHDSVLQDMISLKHQSEMFLADFEKDKVCTNQIRQRLINMNEQMSTVIQTTRETCQELRPQLLYDLGLVKALSKLAAQHQESSSIDKIRLNTERFSKVLDLDTQLNLYRIVQELLSNAVKHSKANEVLIMLVCIKEKVVLHYEDDGIGFDPDKLYQNSASMGLSGIRERVRALNGSLDIQTAEGKGFRVAIEMEL